MLTVQAVDKRSWYRLEVRRETERGREHRSQPPQDFRMRDRDQMLTPVQTPNSQAWKPLEDANFRRPVRKL